MKPVLREPSQKYLLLPSEIQTTYQELRVIMKKANRSRNWNRLTHSERALYVASLKSVRLRKILNRVLGLGRVTEELNI